MDFKVRNPKKEIELEQAAENAIAQIKEKNYKQELVERGIKEEQIRCYGFTFEGKQVLIIKG